MPPRRSTAEGFAAEQHQFVRTADLRYFGQAFEVRVPVPAGVLDAAALAGVADAFHAEHRALYGYDFAGEGSQQVEWVNLRVSGIGPITRPEIRKVESPVPSLESPLSSAGTGDSTDESGDSTARRSVCFEASEGYVDTPVVQRADLAPGCAAGAGRASSRSSAPRCRSTPASRCGWTSTST